MHLLVGYSQFSPELVASLRDPLPASLASSIQGRKLRQVFAKHQQAKTASVTIGALDVITSHLMADLGYDTIYVSGMSHPQYTSQS